MPFLVKTERPCFCRSLPPTGSDYWIGTRWQCEECGSVYELREHIVDGLFWSKEY